MVSSQLLPLVCFVGFLLAAPSQFHVVLNIFSTNISCPKCYFEGCETQDGSNCFLISEHLSRSGISNLGNVKIFECQLPEFPSRPYSKETWLAFCMNGIQIFPWA